MKKVIIIALMACLVLGAAFADGLKVGAEAGYGMTAGGVVMKDDPYSYLMGSQGGFFGAASLEFDASKAFGLKAEFGVLVPSAAYLTVRNGKDDTPDSADMTDTSDLTPICTGYLGLQFNADLAKTLTLSLGVGLDLMFGGEDDDFDLALGAGAETIASFNVSDSLSLNFGGRFGYYFFHTKGNLQEQAEAMGCNYLSFSWKAFGGITINL